jgi:site-specific DNA recombinase
MRVAIYVRVSTRQQVRTQTIEEQLERLQAHVRAQGWTLLERHIFRDDGYSGASLRRPGLDRLRETVATGAVDAVLLTSPDRLARNYVHQVLLLEELGRGGCRIAFLDQPPGDDPHDQLLLQIRGAVAEYERSVIAERMRRGRERKLRAGLLLPWSRPPYGYRLDPERPRDPAGVRLDPAEAVAVREIFARYAEEGLSLMGLARWLQETGICSPRGNRRWNLSTLRGILTNPTYTGQVYAGRTRTRPPRTRLSATRPIGHPGTPTDPAPRAAWIPVAPVPALVSQERFDQVQEKLARNQRFARRNNTAHDYLLRSLVSCGVCQLACTGRSLRPGYMYYLCRAKQRPLLSNRDERCPARFIPAQQLDDLVWRDLCTVLAHPESIADGLARAQGGHWLPQELRARQEVVRQGERDVEQQLDRLTEAYLAGVLPLPEYQRRRTELEQRRHGLRQQLAHLEAQAAHQGEVAAHVRGAAAFCQRVHAGLADASFAQRRQLVELLIDRVIVTDEEVEIRYVIPTSPRGEQTRFCHLRLDYFDRPALPVHPEDLRRFLRRLDWPIGHQPPGLRADARQAHFHEPECALPPFPRRTHPRRVLVAQHERHRRRHRTDRLQLLAPLSPLAHDHLGFHLCQWP